jgi:hypothetical protein
MARGGAYYRTQTPLRRDNIDIFLFDKAFSIFYACLRLQSHVGCLAPPSPMEPV